METLVKSTTLRFSRRADCYEPLDQIQREGREPYSGGGGDDDDERGWRTLSRKLRSRRQQSGRRHTAAVAWSSLSYRRERARRRQVFLQGYKLEASSPAKLRSEKLRKLVARVMKSALVSFASSLKRISAIGNCNSKSAIRVVSPAQVIKCC